MTSRRVVLIATTVAVAAAGCGSSSHHRTVAAEVGSTGTTGVSTQSVPDPTATTVSTADTTSSTAAAQSSTKTTTAPHGTAAPGGKASVKTRSVPGPVAATREGTRRKKKLNPLGGGGSSAGTGAAPPAVVSPEPTTAGISGPTPDACLGQAGLANAHEWQPGEWVGTVPLINVDIYVQGPYADKSAAVAAAEQMQGIERASAGGVYMISAAQTENDSSQLNQVAGCLDATSGHGSLS
jgi:hypothetical protein